MGTKRWLWGSFSVNVLLFSIYGSLKGYVGINRFYDYYTFDVFWIDLCSGDGDKNELLLNFVNFNSSESVEFKLIW